VLYSGASGGYIKAYDWIIEGLIECAEHNPGVNIAVEYKVKEPRTHILVGSAAKTLLVVNAVNRPNVGVNLDTGHANMGYESLAETLALIKRFGDRLMHLHLNDNYRYWDDDMIPGSVHTLEWMEFFYWLDRIGYKEWISLDVFAFRERDKVAVATESIAWIDALIAAAGRLDRKEVEAVLVSGDAMKAQGMVRRALFG
jgi:sugar phosphate isomerase/epimerase